eukprot:763768-Hanusia_phi.AAC.5
MEELVWLSGRSGEARCMLFVHRFKDSPAYRKVSFKSSTDQTCDLTVSMVSNSSKTTSPWNLIVEIWCSTSDFHAVGTTQA